MPRRRKASNSKPPNARIQAQDSKNRFTEDLNENIIICLPILFEDAISNDDTISNLMTNEQNLFKYTPKISVPEHNSSLTDNCEWIMKNDNKSELPVTDACVLASKINVVAKDRPVCMWCCHDFQTSIYNLPLFYKHSEYVVYGKFCSAECAAAYNFHDIVEFGDPWERYSLLHALYFDSYKGKNISLAPSRLSLTMFGGNLTISEFRSKSNGPDSDSAYKLSIAPIKHIKIYSKNQSRPMIPKQLNLKTKPDMRHTQTKHPFTFLTQSR